MMKKMSMVEQPSSRIVEEISVESLGDLEDLLMKPCIFAWVARSDSMGPFQRQVDPISSLWWVVLVFVDADLGFGEIGCIAVIVVLLRMVVSCSFAAVE